MSRTEPSGRRPLAEFRLTRAVAVQWLVTAVVGFFAFAYAFGHVLATVRGVALEPIVVDPSPLFPELFVLALALVAPVVVLHELLHGLCMARYGTDGGSRPAFGIGLSHFVLPYAYAGTEGTRFTRSEMLVVLLTPFVGITAIGLGAMVVYPSPVLLVPLSANAAGSIGDLWMAATLLQYPAGVQVTELGLEDDSTPDRQGFAIHGSPADSGSDGKRRASVAVLSRGLAGAVGTLAAIVGATIVAVFASLAFGSGTVAVGDPNGWFLFYHELRGDGSAVLEVRAPLVLACATLGGVGWTVVAAVREGFALEFE
ncbi:DUF3267 domain-containing protein [Natronobacterium haloterrestre]|uniref:DUF3267 domain-containing protein n=1 Tax=Natronobacterium haloterrestre TaxID=148448 RepID=UPI000B7D49D9|nr:DUF3267 domain-containing protein [Halobiforma haloterrestris]